MNFFGRPQQQTSAERLAAAEQEMELYSNLFNTLTKTCLQKCLSGGYRESDLNKGESVCLDRCSAKFLEANMKVSEKFQRDMESMAAAGGPSAPAAGAGKNFLGF